MTKPSLFLVATGLLAIVMNGVYIEAQSGRSSTHNSGEGAVSLLLHLTHLGEEHNLFFTIENSSIDGETTELLAAYPVPQDSKKTELKEELQRLHNIVPNLTFQVDGRNSRIIHIIDMRLAGMESYSIDQEIHDIKITGMLAELLAEIAHRGIRIAPATAISAGDPLSRGFDRTTSVRISAGPMTVRSILSDFLPFTAYSRVLWTATTERRPGAITSVNFRGLRSDEQTSVPLLSHLYWLGQEHNSFFTIEESWIDGETMNSFVSHQIPRGSTRAALEDELQRISSLVPNFNFQVDGKNPQIIHIADTRLKTVQSYSVDQVVHNIDVTGKLTDLVIEIARRRVMIALQTSRVTGDPTTNGLDFTTDVHAKADQATVRSLLSDFLPLANYRRLLWTAITERRPGAVTMVSFGGKRIDDGESSKKAK